ncbi:MAG: DciA family protein [Nocardioidaceae bacterium]
MEPVDPSPAEPPDPRAVEPVETPDPHDDTGLDLARSVARSLARPGTRPRRGNGGSGGTGGGSGGSGRPFRRRVDPQASGAHPDERDPQLLDSTIGRLIDQQGWGTDVRVHGVFTRWDVIVGSEVASHCRPEGYAEHKLVVRTDSTAWAVQMRLLAPTVVRRLNEELGDGTVLAIDVQGPRGPSWKRGPRSVRDGRGPRDTYG